MEEQQYITQEGKLKKKETFSYSLENGELSATFASTMYTRRNFA